MSRRTTARGFTLVEVLVAIMVMAIMAGMAWQGVDGIVRSRDASQQRLDRTLRTNAVVAQWEQDLSSLQDSGAVPALAFDGATLRLTRRSGVGMQVVAWTLQPDSAGATWLRWASTTATTQGELQEGWLRSQQLQGGEPNQLRALNGVSQWQVYFFQGNAWSNAQSTGNVAAPGAGASAPARQALPSGVRLVLNFAQGSGANGSLIRDALIGP